MRMRKNQQPRGWAVTVAAGILRPTMVAATAREWIDAEKIPQAGGCVVALNHISHIDPLMSAHLVHNAGRVPQYLAKSGLFRNRALGGFLRSAGQIPVARLSANAVGAYDAAVQAVHQGGCVVVYPEGTITRDPDLWPMRGKSGAARIALATGCPVIPVGQWGAHEVLPPYTVRPHVFPRRTVVMKVGDPVHLEDLTIREHTTEVVTEATDRIMAAITDLVAEIRGETPPVERFDPRAAGVRLTGNPKKDKKKRKGGRA